MGGEFPFYFLELIFRWFTGPFHPGTDAVILPFKELIMLTDIRAEHMRYPASSQNVFT